MLASLAEGLTVEEIVREFETLDEAAVRAIIAFAAVSAEEDLPIPRRTLGGMKLKVDENLPSRLVVSHAAADHVLTVREQALTGHPDTDIWSAVRDEGRFLITQDLDFSDMRRYAPGSHPGILLVRLREPGALALADRVEAALQITPIESLRVALRC